MNIYNLKRMYNHISTVPEELLSMEHWRKEYAEMLNHECNTVGCIVGHCVILDTSIIKRKSDNTIDFQRWSEDFTGIPSGVFEFFEWDFLFGSEWAWSGNYGTNSKEQILGRLKQFIFEQELKLEFSWNLEYDYLVTNPNYLDQTPFKL